MLHYPVGVLIHFYMQFRMAFAVPFAKFGKSFCCFGLHFALL